MFRSQSSILRDSLIQQVKKILEAKEEDGESRAFKMARSVIFNLNNKSMDSHFQLYTKGNFLKIAISSFKIISNSDHSLEAPTSDLAQGELVNFDLPVLSPQKQYLFFE